MPAEEKCYIINLAEFDVTGAYAEQAARIIRSMNGDYVKQKFYAIPLERLPNVNKDNAVPKLPFYEEPPYNRTEIILSTRRPFQTKQTATKPKQKNTHRMLCKVQR